VRHDLLAKISHSLARDRDAISAAKASGAAS
jgi:hypothetical protein